MLYRFLPALLVGPSEETEVTFAGGCMSIRQSNFTSSISYLYPARPRLLLISTMETQQDMYHNKCSGPWLAIYVH